MTHSSLPDSLHDIPERGPARRRPWLAGLLGLLLPGVGHLYAGRPRAALVLFVLDALAALLVAYTMPRGTSGRVAVIVPLVLLFAFRIWQALSASRSAGRSDARLWRPRGARYAIALIAAIVFSIVSSEPRVVWTRANVVEAFRCPSVVMAPTLLLGDLFFATPLQPRDLRRDIPVGYLRDDNRFYLSRIAGLAHDTLAMRAGRLLRNGQQIAEPYAWTDSATPDITAVEFQWQRMGLTPGSDSTTNQPNSRNWGPLVVPAAHAFVLGDNRDNSLDSRYLGFIPVERIQRQPRRIYFSRDPDSGSIRWNRIGLDISRAPTR